jgi:hypothetical protein
MLQDSMRLASADLSLTPYFSWVLTTLEGA